MSAKKPKQQRLNFNTVTEAEKKASIRAAFKPNKSILQFFNKTDAPPKGLSLGSTLKKGDDGLFLEGEDGGVSSDEVEAEKDSPGEEKHISRYNEDGGSVKRPRLEVKDDCSPPPPVMAPELKRLSPSSNGDERRILGVKKQQRRGMFFDSSDDEDDDSSNASSGSAIQQVNYQRTSETTIPKEEKEVNTPPKPVEPDEVDKERGVSIKQEEIENALLSDPRTPKLKREATSMLYGDDFDGMEDFDDDEFAREGEEYLERKYMQEMLEMDGDDGDFEDSIEDVHPNESTSGSPAIASINLEPTPEDQVAGCPICQASFVGVSETDASIHVNNCLDGNPTPLPTRKSTSNTKTEPIKTETPIKIEPDAPQPLKRFQRAAIARPGQQNPFEMKTVSGSGGQGSAFSKLMSGHAEDAAWATAAANEVASRGKPAYKRTCPFYKILPGMSICVDAFRYGAVEGCKAYFLSHFHSDHYIGLTSSWCHGPIYCSKVTANLVRQQLKVDPKWVVGMEFEQKQEVPGTPGVFVTMISANHCPGSSLFLYEQQVGRGPNTRLHRVLHCGDFRACPAHVQHPLLRPEVRDMVTGSSKQQRIDVCYLDTTYLNSKYAFPSQEDVITSCADMCISMSKDFVDPNDGWEKTKRERAGNAMTNFITKESPSADRSPKDTNCKARGRLLIVIGTYSIGKERICLGIARALDCKIYAPPSKQRICAALEDPELMSRLTNDPYEAQIHMQMLMEIRAETLADYLTGFKGHFSRIVGFRPSGWNYRPPKTRGLESPLVSTVLHSDGWKSRYRMEDLMPQRGSTKDAACFGVPYSEHSSFRELSMFCCALRIGKIIPTVNVGSQKSRERMKGWFEKWEAEKKKAGLFKVEDDAVRW